MSESTKHLYHQPAQYIFHHCCRYSRRMSSHVVARRVAIPTALAYNHTAAASSNGEWSWLICAEMDRDQRPSGRESLGSPFPLTTHPVTQLPAKLPCLVELTAFSCQVRLCQSEQLRWR